MTRTGTLNAQISSEPEALKRLFDDALDELEITFDAYFDLARYKPRCVQVMSRLVSSGVMGGRVLVLGSNEKAFTMFFRKAGFEADALGLDLLLNGTHAGTTERAATPHQAVRNVQGEYDTIVCDDVLQYLESPAETLTELNDHLKPGGVLIVSTPNAARGTSRLRLLAGNNVFPPLPGPGSTDGDHRRMTLQREYTLRELSELLKDLGFGLIQSECIIGNDVNANTWPPMPVKEYFLQLLFLALQKIAAPLRNYLLVAARKPLVQERRREDHN